MDKCEKCGKYSGGATLCRACEKKAVTKKKKPAPAPKRGGGFPQPFAVVVDTVGPPEKFLYQVHIEAFFKTHTEATQAAYLIIAAYEMLGMLEEVLADLHERKVDPAWRVAVARVIAKAKGK